MILTVKKYSHIIIGTLVVLLFIAPYIIQGTDAHVKINDELDSNVVWFELLARHGKILPPDGYTIDAIMGGLPQSSLGSAINIQILLYKLLPTYSAYVLNLVIVHVLALIGMWLLIRRTLPDSKKLTAIGAAATFAILPFFSSYGLSIAGQPLLFYCFLQLTNGRKRWWHWAYIALFPAYSYFTLSGIFIVAAIGIYAITISAYAKHIPWRMVVGWLLLTAGYAVVEYRFIIDILLGAYTPHRIEFSLERLNVLGAYYRFKNHLLFGEYSSASFHLPVIITATGAAITVMLIQKRAISRRLFLLFAGPILLSFAFTIPNTAWFAVIREQFPLLRMFQLERVSWLEPVAWYLLFAESLRILYHSHKSAGAVAATLLITLQLIIVGGQHDMLRWKSQPTFRQYYAENVYADIARTIGREQNSYRVVSIGLDPAVALHNGFWTIDGYVTVYPIEYKQRFKKIITDELSKNKANSSYFETWGSKAYLFIDELEGKNVMSARTDDLHINRLSLDIDALRELGAEYILSSARLENEKYFKLVKVFTDYSLPYDVYLYTIEPTPVER